MLETDTKDELLERKSLDAVITEDEKQQLKKELSRDNITKALSNRAFYVNQG